MAPPVKAIYREPDVEGRKGLVFWGSRFTLRAVATTVRRSAPFTLGDNPQSWNGRYIEVDFALPSPTGLGVLDSYGFAQELQMDGGKLRIFRGHGDDRVDQPYLLEDTLVFDAVLSEGAFAWLWNETMTRSGTLEIEAVFQTFTPEQNQSSLHHSHLSSTCFLRLAPFPGLPTEEETDVTLKFTITDEWGISPTKG